METFSTILIFIVIAIMAIAIIVLAIWTAKLSSKIKTLSETVYLGRANKTPQSNTYYRQAGTNAQPTQTQQRNYAQQPQTHPNATQPFRPVAQNGYQMSSPQNAVSSSYNAADDSNFFDGYNKHENPNASGSFGRQKPTIPFGEDKSRAQKRDSYAETAADADYDPDSIDFTRVAGYRNFYNR